MTRTQIMDRQQVKYLRNRWATSDFRQLAQTVFQCWQKGQPVSGRGFEFVDQRLDLRGFSLPEGEVLETFSFDNYTVKRQRPTAWFKKLHLDSVDLSCAALRNTVWERALFHNVLFDYANIQSASFFGCEFEDVSFTGTDMRDTTLGGEAGNETNRFHRVKFDNTDLRTSTHGSADYTNCNFKDANLEEVDFDGSRFTECQFSGIISGVRFNRISHGTKKSLFSLWGQRPKSMENMMSRCDFQQAQLRGVDFSDIDLSGCTFPNDQSHVVIQNPTAVFVRLRDFIAANINGNERDIAQRVLELVYLSPEKAFNQLTKENAEFAKAIRARPIAVINRDDWREWFGAEIGDMLFQLIRNMVSESGIRK